jgi:hypothetical protein
MQDELLVDYQDSQEKLHDKQGENDEEDLRESQDSFGTKVSKTFTSNVSTRG